MIATAFALAVPFCNLAAAPVLAVFFTPANDLALAAPFTPGLALAATFLPATAFLTTLPSLAFGLPAVAPATFLATTFLAPVAAGFFPSAGFLAAAGFLAPAAAGFLAPAVAGFLAAGFLSPSAPAGRFVAAFLSAAGFLSPAFDAAAAAGFLSAGFLSAGFLSAGFFSAAGFLSAGFFSAAGFFLSPAADVDAAAAGFFSLSLGFAIKIKKKIIYYLDFFVV